MLVYWGNYGNLTAACMWDHTFPSTFPFKDEFSVFSQLARRHRGRSQRGGAVQGAESAPPPAARHHRQNHQRQRHPRYHGTVVLICTLNTVH